MTLVAPGLRLRRAEPADAPYLAGLASGDGVFPFVSTRTARSEAALIEEIARSQAAPAEEGRFVLEVETDGSWTPAGQLAFDVSNHRSRIAWLHAVMVDPAFRRRRLAEQAVRLLAVHLIRELVFHRVQLEVYGFNTAAIGLFERAGFVREGAKRKAYRRHDAWHDGVLFGLVEEDLDFEKGAEGR